MGTLICLVRHGVTNWNYEGRAQGLADIPLNAEGLRQADAVAVKLARGPWDAIYSSTLSRAYHTASAIARRTGHPEIHRDARLVERNMGASEGTTFPERLARWPGVQRHQLPGMEEDEAMVARAQPALEEIARCHPGGRVICVTHGGLIAALLRSLVPPGASPIGNFHQRNTATTPVLFDGGRFLQQEPSDHSHILVDGIEFSGEKGRVRGEGLSVLLGGVLKTPALDSVIHYATAIESAWLGDRLVGFARCFTDGTLHGYIDVASALPGFKHLLPTLIERIKERYPDVTFTVLPPPVLERSGD